MKHIKNTACMIYLLGVLWFSLVAGCNKGFSPLVIPSPTMTTRMITPTEQGTFTASPTFTPSATKTLTPTPTRTTTQTQTMTPTRTPLSPEQVNAWIQQRLKDNSGCRLPCWWGITPGKSTWEEAKILFAPYIYEMDEGKYNSMLSSYMVFLIKSPEDLGSAVYLNFESRDGIILSINTSITDAPNYSLSEFMLDYGEPGSVLIDGYSPWGNEDTGPRLMVIHIWYPDQGILVEYQAPGIETISRRLLNCIKGSPNLFLWSTEHELTFSDVMKSVLNGEYEYLPVSEALGMDVKTFYQTYKGANREICLDTALNRWMWKTETPTPTP